MRKDVLRETNEATDKAEAMPYPAALRTLYQSLRRSLAAVAVSTTSSTVMNNVEAVRATLYEAMKNRRPHDHPRRRRRRARQRLPHHQGLHQRVRPGARHRHADRRSVDRRHRGRHGDGRLAADRRDSVRRLHLSGVQPDRRRGRQDALSQQRRVHVSAGHPHALRRRRSRRALALGFDRSAVLSRSRA